MKKTLFMFLFIVFVIAGCSNGNVNNNNINDKQTNNNNEVNNETDQNEINNENNDEVNGNETNDEISLEATLKEESEAFFAVQLDKDVAKIESFLASSATYDKEKDLFYFDEISYPHEMERFEIENADLEYRYFNDEDVEKPIVGFASVNYEEEY